MENAVKTANGTSEAKGVRLQAILEKTPPAAPSQRNKILIGVGAALAVAGAAFFIANRGWVSTDDAFIEAHVAPVSAKVQGHVLRVLVEDNQAVKKDDVLAELEPQDYLTRRDDARAVVAGAEAEVRKNDLDVKRYQTLFERRESSRQTLDHALADAQSAKAALEAAQARLRQAALDLSYTKITAPQDGRVTRKSMEAGAFVSVGQPLLAVVPSEVWIVANFKETQLRDMKPGQKAEIKIDAYPGKLRGHVDSLQAGTGARFSLLPPENATGNFVKVVQRMPVKIVLDETPAGGRLLAPGMSVEAEVQVK
jgi:membrane fusion protein (multidrug efflux system)